MANKPSQAVRLIEAGKEAEAHRLLAEVLKNDPTNDEAWVLMAVVAKTDAQQEKCLREALKFNPRNQTAVQALLSLKKRQRSAPAGNAHPTTTSVPTIKAPSGILKGLTYAAGVIIVAATILGIALFLQWEQITGEARWKEFTSEEGHFSVLLPRTPTQTTETVDTPVGEVDENTFTTIHASITYVVSYSDYPQSLTAGDTRAVLNALRDSAVTGFSGKLLSERSISLNGHPGRELKIQVSDDSGTVITKLRIFLVRNRLYYLYAIVSEEHASSPSIDRFLNSFRLVQ